eukprot:scaffold609_cov170-Amphora_coffeaeformis.AAC.33
MEEKVRAKRVAKWKEQATHLHASGDRVYVLTHEDIDQANHHRPKTRIIGVYDSRDAAVVASMNVESQYGRFDEAMKELFEVDHEDNRENRPDNGVLIQLGSEGSGKKDIPEYTCHTDHQHYGIGSNERDNRRQQEAESKIARSQRHCFLRKWY